MPNMLDAYVWRNLTRRASECQAYFTSIDESEYKSNGAGNAAYIVLQAQEYLQSVKEAAGDSSGAYKAFASSDLSRILAIALRECLRNKWDFMQLLAEGIEYEESVVEDIKNGMRKAKSHRGAHLLD